MPQKPDNILNEVDSEDNPAGGLYSSNGLMVRWQRGCLGRGTDKPMEPNGAFVEDVLEAARQRLEWFQTALEGRFACRENALAITKLEEAIHWLEARTKARQERGVANTYIP